MTIFNCITRTLPFAEEVDEPELLTGPRIAFAYNRQSAGRLNQLILALNSNGRYEPISNGELTRDDNDPTSLFREVT